MYCLLLVGRPDQNGRATFVAKICFESKPVSFLIMVLEELFDALTFGDNAFVIALLVDGKWHACC